MGFRRWSRSIRLSLLFATFGRCLPPVEISISLEEVHCFNVTPMSSQRSPLPFLPRPTLCDPSRIATLLHALPFLSQIDKAQMIFPALTRVLFEKAEMTVNALQVCAPCYSQFPSSLLLLFAAWIQMQCQLPLRTARRGRFLVFFFFLLLPRPNTERNPTFFSHWSCLDVGLFPSCRKNLARSKLGL